MVGTIERDVESRGIVNLVRTGKDFQFHQGRQRVNQRFRIISDPGARVVETVRAAGLPVIPLPGASSITAIMSATGSLGEEGGFVFFGFLPAKGGERQQAVESLRQEARAVVLLEAPHRIAVLAAILDVAVRDRARR